MTSTATTPTERSTTMTATLPEAAATLSDAMQCQCVECPECGEVTYPEMSDTEVDALVDGIHGPCFKLIADMTDRIKQLSQPGAMWFNPESSDSLIRNLNQMFAFASIVYTDIENGARPLAEARALRDALEQLSELRPHIR